MLNRGPNRVIQPCETSSCLKSRVMLFHRSKKDRRTLAYIRMAMTGMVTSVAFISCLRGSISLLIAFLRTTETGRQYDNEYYE